jgi:hypothetical protein
MDSMISRLASPACEGYHGLPALGSHLEQEVTVKGKAGTEKGGRRRR